MPTININHDALAKEFLAISTTLDTPPLESTETKNAVRAAKDAILSQGVSYFPSLKLLGVSEIPNLLSEQDYNSEDIFLDYTGQHMRKPGFDLKKAVAQLDGVSLEVAGPSVSGFALFEELTDKKLHGFVSNITDGIDHRNLYEGIGHIDLRADAGKLPVRGNSLAVLFVSCIPDEGELVKDTFLESERVLKDGGIVVWIGAPKDAQLGEQAGLTVQEAYIQTEIARTVGHDPEGIQRAHIIFQKQSAN